jgi:HD-like signal output (HDOD) protein/ActR/RegA family two-component response regulator
MTLSKKYTAVFVDDDDNVLDGLKRVLRPMRQTWDIDFVSGGPDALRLFDEKQYDLIVSDMRMPGMDGAELLATVRKRSPRTVRIILSGHSERENILKTVLPAHQYYSKPAGPDDIKSMMDQVANVLTLLRKEHLKKLVSAIEALPCLPDYHSRLMTLIDAEHTSLEDIADLISKDIGMTTNVFKVVNSSFFGHPKEVSELTEAVWWLGLELLRALTLTGGLFASFKIPCSLQSFFKASMEHSLAVATAAKAISEIETTDKTAINASLLAGVLHDVGKLLLAYLEPGKYMEVLARSRNREMDLSAIEEEFFGASHAETGGFFTGLWGMNLSVITAIAYHHRPLDSIAGGRIALLAVHAANALVHEINDHGIGPGKSKIDACFLEKENACSKIAEWRRMVK